MKDQFLPKKQGITVDRSKTGEKRKHTNRPIEKKTIRQKIDNKTHRQKNREKASNIRNQLFVISIKVSKIETNMFYRTKLSVRSYVPI